MGNTKFDSRQSVLRAALGVIGSVANDSLDTIFPKIDAELAKYFEDRNILLTDGGTVTFTGTQLQFSENLNLVLNQKISGAAPQVISLGSANVNFSATNQMWYAVIDRTAGTAVSTTGATTMPAVTSTNQEVFLIAKRVDAADGTQRIYFRNGSALNAGQSVRLGASGSGSGSGGTGDDLDALLFRASFNDTFGENAANANSSINATGSNATFNAAKSIYAISYDASATVTGTGTAMTMSAAPAFTVVAGDSLIVAGTARKIVTVTSQTAYVLEAAFAANPTAAACTVSQTVYTKDIYNFAVDGAALSAGFSGATFSEILVDYKDNATAASNLFTPNVAPFVGFSASNDNTNFTTVSSRPTNETDTVQSVILPSAGTALYLRFFANRSSGSGTVNLITYKAFMQKAVSQVVQGGISWSAYAFLNGVGTPVNCTVSLVGGKSTITLTNGNQYAVGVNSGQPYGALDFYVNGQLIPRYINTTLTPDASFTETSGTVLTLDKDYSGQNLSVEIVQKTQVIDTSTTNTTAIAAIQAQLASGGAGGGGSKNYLTAYTASTGSGAANTGNGDFESNSTTGWSLFNATLTGVLPTGTIGAGAASISTFGTINSGSLSKKYSLNTASSGALSAGQGFISDAFFIDQADQAKMMTVTASYKVISGLANMNFSGTSSNTWAAYIYDTTNAAWIQPAGVYNLVQGSGVGKLSATFQTTSNSTQYRLALICINASGGATSMLWDDFTVGPQTSVSGPAMSDFVAYTPSVLTGFGSVSNLAAYSRRVGDTLEVQGYLTSTTATGVTAQFGLGYNGVAGNVTADSAKVPLGGVVGYASTSYSSATDFGSLTVLANNAAYVTFGINASAGSSLSSTVGTSIGTSPYTISFSFRVPIVGWSSNSVMSADTDTRVVAAIVGGAPPAATAGNPLIFPTVSKDTHAAYNATTGQYTAPVSGYYQAFVSAAVGTSTNGQNAYVSVAGNTTPGPTRPRIAFIPTAAAPWAGSQTVYALAGQTIDIRVTQNTTLGDVGDALTIQRVSGPAVVAATEIIACIVGGLPPSAVANNPLIFPTVVKDTHGGYNATTGKYAFPAPGFYQVSVSTQATMALGNNVYASLNGATISSLVSPVLGWAAYTNAPVTGYGLVYASAAGQTVDIRASTATGAGSGSDTVSIVRVKN